MPRRIVVATHNPGKLREFERLFSPWAVEVVGAASFGVHAVDENADDYRGNAILKAEAVAQATGLPSIGDDAGFEVEALPGWLGIHTARCVLEEGGYPAAIATLSERLALPTRRPRELAARLVCALAWAQPGALTRTATGVAAGWLRWPPTTAPGFAAVLETARPLFDDGVLAHRRDAFAELIGAQSS